MDAGGALCWIWLMSARLAYFMTALFVAIAAWVEWLNGRLPICKCGYVKLWESDVWSSGNSQHLADWYTPSHIIHGILFFALIWLVARRLSLPWRLAVAMGIEAAWEMLENSAMVIERYRTVTMSLDYFGDSIINSVMDMLAMVLGFWAAARLPVWASVAIVLGFEALTAYTIRDGLALNVLMLLYPVQVVLDWQSALAH